jgi:hypothetical protein
MGIVSNFQYLGLTFVKPEIPQLYLSRCLSFPLLPGDAFEMNTPNLFAPRSFLARR